ncbi:MAG TPA: DoxX family membrane protein [Candidatus Hydrogenedentes bacterium]|nr:DoxX family membrane protein [Candidatus Hydrogenedentota bacterium]
MKLRRKKPAPHVTLIQSTALVLLRVAIGWHFLYEGISKLLTPGWSAEGYLRGSRWIFAETFTKMASDPTQLFVVNQLNKWGLMLIGLCLVLGLFSRLVSLLGAVLVLFYYAAYPPLFLGDFGTVREGSYLIVDKNLVEILALCVLMLFPTGRYAGLDSFLARRKKTAAVVPVISGPAGMAPMSPPPPAPDRRAFVQGIATLPFMVAFGAALVRKRSLISHEEKDLVDAVSSATIKTFNFASLKDLKGEIPKAAIGSKQFSRVILGGNLIGGWAHARDLIYVSKLVKAYHHRDKIFETFMLAEQCGINAILTNPILCGTINEYWRQGLGKIQFISDCGGEDLLERVTQSIDKGAAACYVQGATADRLAAEGKFDLIAQALDRIRANGLPAGIGGHDVITVRACADKGLKPDFWMKTVHPKTYWSARHPEENDNVFCKEPEETIAFMKDRQEPWIAFKILAAGAIDPKEGFRYAFENGADFICVGMYDFQMVENANLALELLNGNLTRPRRWSA